MSQCRLNSNSAVATQRGCMPVRVRQRIAASKHFLLQALWRAVGAAFYTPPAVLAQCGRA
eukprot:9593781-Karenia_brevis.AAC.1